MKGGDGEVHPTGVGMIRRAGAASRKLGGSSHRRGNDSEVQDMAKERLKFIPQAWE